ncbi:hypothetical protein QJQ45_029633 [Haematococcus lacustris]|nr:hypothetical protein QJQ45_029633 [Haematococcus lacustris]
MAAAAAVAVAATVPAVAVAAASVWVGAAVALAAAVAVAAAVAAAVVAAASVSVAAAVAVAAAVVAAAAVAVAAAVVTVAAAVAVAAAVGAAAAAAAAAMNPIAVKAAFCQVTGDAASASFETAAYFAAPAGSQAWAMGKWRATAGIGRAIAERLAEEGAAVYICSRQALFGPSKKESVDETVAALRAKGYTAAGCACHVGSAKQLKAFVESGVKEFGRIDVLVSNAAVSPAAAPITETTEDAIDKILNINLKSAVLLVQYALPHMKTPGAAIVINSSVTAYNPPLPIGMYAVSKTALLGLVKGLAAELGPQGIRVTGLAPGIVPTKLSSYLVQSPELHPLQAQQQADATYLKRLGTPEDMAATVAFLASGDAAYVTGETLVVAGGMPSKL